MIPADTQKQIEDILAQVRELTWCHAIWWEIVERENRQKHEKAFQKYNTYFYSTARLMQEELVIIICRLFEDKPDVCSFQTLIEKLKNAGLGETSKFIDEIQKKEQLLSYFRKVRNKVHAHRDLKLTPEAVYRSVYLKVPDLDAILLLCEQLAAGLSEACDLGSKDRVIEELHWQRNQAMHDTLSLLNVLSDPDT